MNSLIQGSILASRVLFKNLCWFDHVNWRFMDYMLGRIGLEEGEGWKREFISSTFFSMLGFSFLSLQSIQRA